MHGAWSKQSSGVSAGGWPQRGFLKTVDPLYFWSAAVGLFVATVLIAVGLVMQTGHMH
jgi:hypothetical protein